MRGVSAGEGYVWWLWVHEARKFVHEWGILCVELVVAWKFVHEWGILCAELVVARKFVQEWGILCVELRGVLGKRRGDLCCVWKMAVYCT